MNASTSRTPSAGRQPSPDHFASSGARGRLKRDYLLRVERAPYPRPHWRWLRRHRDLGAVIGDRCGRHLPADDAGRQYLQLLINHLMRLVPHGRTVARASARLWAPWLAYNELDTMLEIAVESWQCKPISAAKLGTALRLTTDERKRLGITSIAAFDNGAHRSRQFRAAHRTGAKRGRPALQLSPEERRTRRLAQEAARKRLARASAKNAKRASLYEAMGVTELMRTLTPIPAAALDLDTFDFNRFGIIAITVMHGTDIIHAWPPH